MKTEKPKIMLTVPEELASCLNTCLRLHAPTFLNNPSPDYFLYIIHKIVTISNYNGKFKNLHKIPISSKVLRYEIGKDYRKYLTYLIEWGFIESDNYYIVGTANKHGKCKCYGLASKYRECTLTRVEIKKAHLLKKIIRWKQEKFGPDTNDSMMGHLYDMMHQFTIDIESARGYLQDMVDTGKLTPKKMSIEMDKCERINRGDDEPLDLFIVKDDYNRIHTNFTNISKNIRENFLKLNGKSVTSLDIVSCQPALLYTMFESYVDKLAKVEDWNGTTFLNLDHTWGNRQDPRERYCNKKNWCEGDFEFEDDINMEPSTLGYQRVDHAVSVARQDLIKYKQVLQSGIYEFFQSEHLRIHGSTSTRDAIKKQWITFVFGDGEGDYNAPMRKIWESQFPVLLRMLTHFKAGNYKVLAHALQRKEADLIFNQVCPTINDNVGVSYCTVHDSIIVESEYASRIGELFSDVLLKNNIPTKVKIS